MVTYILIILVLLACSAYFSAAETSFSALNKMRLKKAADSGSKTAQLAYKMSERFTTALSAILIGNNLANTAASTVATVATVALLTELIGGNVEGLASVISTAVMTVIVLIFCEVGPKIIAKNNADKMIYWFAYPIRIITIILYPVIWIIMSLIKLLSKLWGKDDEEAPTVTEEELSSIIETVEEEGVIDEDQSELLQSTLDFRDTTVEEIMTPRINMTAFDISDDISEIAQVINESRHSRIPVYEDSIDEIIGILYLNHYYKAATDKDETADIRSLLMAPLMLHKTMKLPAALATLREKKVHLAIVVDEYGGTLGVVTMEDILEELVGDIWDESDEIVTEFTQTGENTFEVSGDMNIDDFFEEIEFEPVDFSCEYSTMGGLAIEKLDADPHIGDCFTLSDRDPEEDDDFDEELGESGRTELHIVVSAMEEVRVTKLTVLVTKITRKDDDEDEDKE